MSLTKWLSRLPFFPPSPSPIPHRTNWVDDTFISRGEAEAALCNDRPSFVVRDDIMTLVPDYITACMIHPDPRAQISGFRELFIYLNKNRSSTRLRRMIEDYFDNSPPLRGHLSQSFPVLRINENTV